MVQQDDKIDDFVNALPFKKIRENFDVSYLFNSWHEYVDFFSRFKILFGVASNSCGNTVTLKSSKSCSLPRFLRDQTNL